MRLFIAEKPSAALDLAQFLGIERRGSGFSQCRGGVVTWCVGHMLESAEPEDYDPALKTWRIEALPIVPSKWKYLVKAKTKSQLAVIGDLLKHATSVVNFGDPDNEGQLLVDEVLEHFRCKLPVQRLWLQALDPVAMAAGLNDLQPNENYSGMRDAARARGQADWMVGMNFSRAYTLSARAKGGSGVRPVGRVQTPTLSLVADRCAAVANFTPIPYHTIHANVAVATGHLKMLWKAGEKQPGLDPEKRLVDRAVADDIVSRLTGAVGVIDESETKPVAVHPPRSFSLLTLTVLASKVFGYKSAQVLAGCQALYETYKLTSYPRTDCEYLPESQHTDAPTILAALGANIPGVAGALEFTDTSLKSKTWDDSKVTAHHGIIPRPVRFDFAKLPQIEANLYQLIARAYLAQFFPLHEYLETKVTALIDGETFAASGRVVTMPGWKALYNDDDEKTDVLPVTVQGESASIIELVRESKKTKPPSLFTEGTLQQAMEHIHNKLEDAEDKRAMETAEGIGTPATRTAIIEELKNRKLLVDDAKGKFIVATQAAYDLLADLPDLIKSPVMAARWERQLRSIEQGQLPMSVFVADQAGFIAEQVALVRAAMPVPVTYACPDCEGGQLRKIPYKNNHFWGCSNYPATCKSTFPDADNKPLLPQ